MPLITRQYGPNAKGSKLTIEEMDDNLLYLQAAYNYIGDSSTNTDVDWEIARVQELNLDNDPSLSFSNGVIGQKSKLLLRQTLSGTRTVTWPNEVIWNNSDIPSLQNINPVISLDNSFITGDGFDNGVYDVILQPDGKIIAVGDFSTYDNNLYAGIVRLNPDGAKDLSFSIGSGFVKTPLTLALQSDGKILVGGNISGYNGTLLSCIIRLNGDGSIDNTFNTGSGFSGGKSSVSSITVQSDGKILVGGGFTDYNGTAVSNIVRLNSNGTIDDTFNFGIGFNSIVYDMELQSDGKVIVVGDFSSYNGTPVNRIIRLNSNGMVDGSFNSGGGFDNYPLTIKIQVDGKIICGGTFTNYNGTPANRIIRLNSNGMVDGSFNSGGGFDSVVNSIGAQSDGKLVCGGYFTDYDGTSTNSLTRLNNDGSNDVNFVIGSGFNDAIDSLIIQLDGKIVCVGSFFDYNGISIGRIARLTNGITPFYNQINFIYNGTDYIGSY